MKNSHELSFSRKKNKFLPVVVIAAVSFFLCSHLYAGEQLKIAVTIYGNEVSKPLNQPCGLFYDEEKQRLYIADTLNNRLLAFNSDWSYLSEFTAEGKLELPVCVLKGRKGRLYITESQKNRVTIIDVKQKSIDSLDFSRVPQKCPVIVGNMSIDNMGNLYVVDRANKRILVFNDRDKYIKEITGPAGSVGFNDVRVDKNGNIYTIDTVKGRVYIFNQNGEMVLNFGKRGPGKGEFDFPVSLAVDERGFIYIVDRHKNSVLIFSDKGNFLEECLYQGWREGRLNYPEYIFIDQSQRIYIVDRDNNRINVYKR